MWDFSSLFYCKFLTYDATQTGFKSDVKDSNKDAHLLEPG